MSEAQPVGQWDAFGRKVTRVVPTDPVFARWMAEDFYLTEDGLAWCPRGMGALTCEDLPYDEMYFAKYQKMNLTEQGRQITYERTEMVRRWAGGTPPVVIDVGIGSGAFIMGRQAWTWGYDVNPAGVTWLREQGRYKDPYAQPFHVATLWDVLEHIPEPKKLLDNVKHWVFMSCPIWPGDADPPGPAWKHFKPQEHCWYWTRDGLIDWMAEHGFMCREFSEIEVRLGREDIGSFAFERV